MWVAYAGMCLFFGGVGVAMLVSAFAVMPNRAQELADRILRQPQTVARVWLTV